jgi:hypothetical protein
MRAQGIGVDSMQVGNELVDCVADNKIKDSIRLNSNFVTIERENNKYFIQYTQINSY